MMNKIALLSHRGGNIGHDFMAIGMEEVAKYAHGQNIEIDHFEQHHHFSVYPEGHPIRLIDKIPHGRLTTLRRLANGKGFRNYFKPSTARLKEFSLAIACGGPNIVRNISRSAEMNLMFHHMYGTFSGQGVPVYDLAVGSCFPLEQIPSGPTDAFTENDIACYRGLFETTARSTVRDELAHKLWNGMGRSAALIPCVAFCSGLYAEKSLTKAASRGNSLKKTVLINYQAKGSNSDWGQNVDTIKWLKVLKDVVADLKKRHDILFMCHNTWETKLAKLNFPGEKILQPKTVDEYFTIAAGVSAAIASRIHCVIPLASIGVPSITIGTDTRIGAVKQLGMPTHYVKDVSAEMLIGELEMALKSANNERGRLRELRESVLNRYAKIISA